MKRNAGLILLRGLTYSSFERKNELVLLFFITKIIQKVIFL